MARRRFTVRDIDEILSYWHHTGSIQATARSLGVHRDTVRRYTAIARSHGYTPGGAAPPQGWKSFVIEVMPEAVGRTHPSEAMKRIESFHQEIVEGLAQTNAATVWQRLRDEAGLQAFLTSFYRYVHQHVSPEKARQGVTVRREDPPPGDLAEVDFGTLGMWWDPVAGKKRRLHAFIMVLGHSRHMFVWVTPVMDQQAWVQAHIEAFAFFTAAPARVVLDNLKSGVLKADIYDPQFNRTYEELARHYSFIIDPARARKPREKPKVERMVPFVRSSFWKGRQFGSLPEINAAARTWCREVAGKRTHGTTGLQPLAHFASVERPAMTPLSREPFQMSRWTQAKVGPDCHIQVGRSLYSVPYLHAGKTLDVRITDHTVECFWQEELVKVHPRVAPRTRSTDWQDYPPEKARVLQENPDWCRRRARQLGEAIAWSVETLLAGHAQHYLRQARGVLRLAEQYGSERLEAACRRARSFEDPSYRTIRSILERGLDRELVPIGSQPSLAGAYLRGPETLFDQSRVQEGGHE
jgi:transposase